MTAPAFVTVNTAGIPAGHDTAAAAIDAHLRDIGGDWNLFGDRRPQVVADLDRDGESIFWMHRDGSQPMAAAVFRNDPGRDLPGKIGNGRPWAVRFFQNAHILHRENSRNYLAEAAANWGRRVGPRVGDYVRHLDGSETRFTHDWGDGLQAGGGRGSYHISRGGFASYSGGLSARIPRARLTATGETRPGEFWFFLDGWTGAHRGVYVQLSCRIYKERAAQ